MVGSSRQPGRNLREFKSYGRQQRLPLHGHGQRASSSLNIDKVSGQFRAPDRVKVNCSPSQQLPRPVLVNQNFGVVV